VTVWQDVGFGEERRIGRRPAVLVGALVAATALLGWARLHDSQSRTRASALSLRVWIAAAPAQAVDPAALHIAMRPGAKADPRAFAAPRWIAIRNQAAPRLWLYAPAAGRPAAPAGELAAPAGAPLLADASSADRERALDCLAAAVHYEAAGEPLAGQQAVAQVVVNRLRTPGYPKSVCGVVFQGSDLPTGCQFTFTCDGSLGRRPSPSAWSRARAVAERTLDGFVMTAVGSATNYHADYVRPYWSAALTRIVQIGAHIFYRRGEGGPAPGQGPALHAPESGLRLPRSMGPRPTTAHPVRRGPLSFSVVTLAPLNAEEVTAGEPIRLGGS
jgi:hypothetical protein